MKILQKINVYVLLLIALLIGVVMGANISTANAGVTNTQNIQNVNGRVNYDRQYVNGRYYVIFYNEYGLSAVKE